MRSARPLTPFPGPLPEPGAHSRQYAHRYFANVNLIPALVLVTSGIMLYLNGPQELFALAAVIGIAGAIWIARDVVTMLSRPSDNDYDLNFERDVENLMRYASDELDIGAEYLLRQDPLVIYSPYTDRYVSDSDLDLPRRLPANDTKQRTGHDGYTRWSINHIRLVFLTKDSISIYQCLFSSLKGGIYWQRSVEFYYDRVRNVSKKMQAQSVPISRSGWGEPGAMMIKHLNISLDDGEVNLPITFSAQETAVDDFVIALRSILREYRSLEQR